MRKILVVLIGLLMLSLVGCNPNNYNKKEVIKGNSFVNNSKLDITNKVSKKLNNKFSELRNKQNISTSNKEELISDIGKIKEYKSSATNSIKDIKNSINKLKDKKQLNDIKYSVSKIETSSKNANKSLNTVKSVTDLIRGFSIDLKETFSK